MENLHAIKTKIAKKIPKVTVGQNILIMVTKGHQCFQRLSNVIKGPKKISISLNFTKSHNSLILWKAYPSNKCLTHRIQISLTKLQSNLAEIVDFVPVAYF